MSNLLFFTTSNFVLYPNPTDGLIFLEIKNNTNPQLKYSITDILGRKILEAEISRLIKEKDRHINNLLILKSAFSIIDDMFIKENHKIQEIL